MSVSLSFKQSVAEKNPTRLVHKSHSDTHTQYTNMHNDNRLSEVAFSGKCRHLKILCWRPMTVPLCWELVNHSISHCDGLTHWVNVTIVSVHWILVDKAKAKGLNFCVRSGFKDSVGWAVWARGFWRFKFKMMTVATPSPTPSPNAKWNQKPSRHW